MQKKHIITIAGKPGSGKSTTANLVAKELDFRRFSSGDFIREIATERNITLAELHKRMVEDRSYDEMVDGKLRDLGEVEDNLVIDSRLAFHWIPTSFKVFLDLDLPTAAERIRSHQVAERLAKGEVVGTAEEFLASLERRLTWEQEQYETLYGVNPGKLSQYDLVVDTKSNQPDSVARLILDGYYSWIGEN